MNITVTKAVYIKIKSSLNLQIISLIRFITVIVLLMKTTLFLTLLESSDASNIASENITFQFSMVHLAFILLLFSFGYLFSKRKQINFYIILNIVYSLILILDLWYFRINRDFFGLKNIFFTGTFNPIQQSLFAPKPVDTVFIVDILLILIYIKLKGIKSEQSKSILKFAATFSLAIVCLVVSYILIDVVGIARWDKRMFKVGWSPLMTIRVPGPIGYHGFEAYNTLGKILRKSNPEENQAVNQWLLQNKEQLQDNQYKGLIKGKNVIFLQLESFENFVINNKANGKELTPFLNKLTKEGLYFNNIYEQNNAGNSIDCDFMVNTSILPLGDNITALNYGEDVYRTSLSKILKSEGYTTVASHAEEKGEFNWTELHKNGFGTDILWDLSQYKYEETVGYGLSDKSFLTQLADKIKTLPQPFYLNAPTLSSHGPFNIPEKYRQLGLPKEIDESYLGGYFESVHYTDEQVERFLEKLDEEGILNNTVIVIYGDHTGVHKYYNEAIQKLSFEGDWWKEYDHKIPLIIYSKGVAPKLVTAPGGQIDIMPTVAYMLGIPDSKYRNDVMGRILVNTNRAATIIKDNKIEGQVMNENEKEHLLNSYDIASKIIKNRYMEK